MLIIIQIFVESGTLHLRMNRFVEKNCLRRIYYQYRPG